MLWSLASAGLGQLSYLYPFPVPEPTCDRQGRRGRTGKKEKALLLCIRNSAVDKNTAVLSALF